MSPARFSHLLQRRPLFAVVAVALCVLASACEPGGSGGAAAEETASFVVENARVWTADPERPWAEAVAVAEDRILAVGTAREIEPLAGPRTRRIDAGGALVTPGFVDSHVHFLDAGAALSSVKLRDAATSEDFVRRIRDFAGTVPAGVWIRGGNWDHENWGGELPDRDWIDAATPEHPVWVNRLDGHMALANSLALELAGVDGGTPDPPGGTIVRDASGRATGVLKDNAMALVQRVVTAPSREQEMAALQAAMRHVAAQGITSVHHMGTWADLEAFRRARDEERLTTRIYAAVPLDTWERLAADVEANGRGDEWLRVGVLKGFVDGSLGSHTAAFFEPFSDVAPRDRNAPESRGLLVTEPADLERWIRGAAAAGLHLAVHAIGDRANALLLDLYRDVLYGDEAAGGGAGGSTARDRRLRIEHAQHLRAEDIPRFAELGVVASMQPYHAIDDGRWAERVIGPQRIQTTYAFRSLLDAGAALAFGSDWDVAPASVVDGLYAAVTRRTLDGPPGSGETANPDGWVPGERISLEEALVAYTRGGAYASFEEDLKGSLTPGKLADLVVFDRDLFAVEPETLRSAQVVLTLVGGEVVYERDGGAERLHEEER